MSLCPFATHRILPENATQGSIVPVSIVDHTQAGTGSLYNYWLTGTSLESHFWIALDGRIEQYIDTSRSADANYKANRFSKNGRYEGAISIETENSRHAVETKNFNGDYWTDAQKASLTRLHKWLTEAHNTIQRRRCGGPYESGLGYHVMFGAPSDWTNARGKECPGKGRIDQWHSEILPAFVGGTVTPPVNQPSYPPAPTLRKGDKGAAVQSLQRALNAAQKDTLGTDGDFGPRTEGAVARFQREHGLGGDGIYGPLTQTALQNVIWPPKPKPTPPVKPNVRAPAGVPPIAPPVNPDRQRVIELQYALNYASGAGLHPSGFYGPETEKAVSNIQLWFKAQGKDVDVTGVYDEKTRAVLQFACDEVK